MKTNYKIAIGVDHRGYELKQYLISLTKVKHLNVQWLDCGTDNQERTDYPIYAKKVIDIMLSDTDYIGILGCGSGIGMSIVANRYAGIYAGLVWNAQIAKCAKEDDNVNVLVLPTDYISKEESVEIIFALLTAEFKEGRYRERLNMIDCN